MAEHRPAQWAGMSFAGNVEPMKPSSSVRSALQVAAGLVLAGTFGTWIATGSHRGWTQTLSMELHVDEVTGLTYPVQKPGFVAGVEFPAGGAALAAILSGLSLVVRRRSSASSVSAVQS